MTKEKKTYLIDLVEGQKFSLPLMVKDCQRRLTVNGDPFLSLILADRSKSYPAKVWNQADQLAPFLTVGQINMISGEVSNFKGVRQLIVQKLSRLDLNLLDMSDFVQTPSRGIPEMTKELWALVASLKDGDYRLLATKALEDPKTSVFFAAPAAKSFHHAYPGGLL